MTAQTIAAAVLGLAVLTTVTRLSRRGQLSFRYAIGWIGVASLGVLAGVFVPLVEPVARWLGVSAAALVASTGLLFLILIAIQLSISISGLQRQVRTLTEEIARLRHDTKSQMRRN